MIKFSPKKMTITLFVFLNILMFSFACTSAGESVLKLPGKQFQKTAVVMKPYAEIRKLPNATADLVGYLPGAIPVMIDKRTFTNGWYNVYIFWNYQDEMWIKSTDVAFLKQFVHADEQWDLYYLFLSTEMGNMLYLFPESNDCSQGYAEKLANKAYKSIKKHDKLFEPTGVKVECIDVWHLPKSNIFYLNTSDGDAFVWYDKSIDKVLLHTFAEGYFYEHRNGKIGGQNFCIAGEWVGCMMNNRTKPRRVPPSYPPKDPDRDEPG